MDEEREIDEEEAVELLENFRSVLVKSETGRHPANLSDEEEREAVENVVAQNFLRLKKGLENGKKEFRCKKCGRYSMIETDNRYQVTTVCPACGETATMTVHRCMYDFSEDAVTPDWDKFSDMFPGADSPDEVDADLFKPERSLLSERRLP